jgi:uncharacterized protein (DUF58 family)
MTTTTTRWPTPKVGGYAALTVLGAATALALGRPEPALLAAPFALFLAVGAAFVRPADHGTRIDVTADPSRAIEGDTIHLHVDAPPRSRVRVVLPRELRPTSPTEGEAPLAAVAARWGAHRIGPIASRRTDPLGLFVDETVRTDRATVVRVHPRPEALRRTVAAAELRRRVGDRTSRQRGDGVEFADIRPFRRGDRARNVNWRASARRPNDLLVNDRSPERNADVVLLLDTFGDDRSHRRAALERAVRALAAVAAAHGDARDRIGFLAFGGQLRWVEPGLGQRALVRVVDGLLDAEVLLSSTWEDVQRVPVGALPPKALLLAVTSLDNDIAVETLADLRSRGFDVAVVSLPLADDALGATTLGRRFAVLQRDARRLELERLGIAVGTAARLQDLAVAIEEVEACRRRLPRVRA